MSQHVISVKSLSLLHYNAVIYLLPVMFMDELEDIHADQTNICFYHYGS